MDQDGALARGGDLELADKPLALNGMRGAFVIVVEADFTAGNDLGLGEKAVELGWAASSASAALCG